MKLTHVDGNGSILAVSALPSLFVLVMHEREATRSIVNKHSDCQMPRWKLRAGGGSGTNKWMIVAKVVIAVFFAGLYLPLVYLVPAQVSERERLIGDR